MPRSKAVARAPATPARQTRLRARDQVSFLTNGHDPESCSVGARAVCETGRRRGGARARQTAWGRACPADGTRALVPWRPGRAPRGGG